MDQHITYLFSKYIKLFYVPEESIDVFPGITGISHYNTILDNSDLDSYVHIEG